MINRHDNDPIMNGTQTTPEHTGELHCYTVLNIQGDPVPDNWRKFFPVNPDTAPELHHALDKHRFGPFHPDTNSLRPLRLTPTRTAMCQDCKLQIRQGDELTNGITLMFNTGQDALIESYYLPGDDNNWRPATLHEFYRHSAEVVPLATS